MGAISERRPPPGGAAFPPGVRRIGRAVAGLLVILSLAPRLTHLDAPLLDLHGFRQTQVAITIWSMAERGIHPLSYETPVFGPPWRVPYEFPLFHMTAALLLALGVDAIDVAGRIANLFFFYLSAAFLFLLCRRHLRSVGAALCVLLVYVWSPFDLFWSRTCMIDFASVACSLAYLHLFTRWLDRGARLDALFAAVLAAGILAHLSKVTTTAVVLIPLLYAAVVHLRRGAGGRRAPLLAALAAAFILPFAVGYAWVEHAELVRAGSPFTAWLNVGSEWFYGRWSDKLDAAKWMPILATIGGEFFPLGLAILVPAAVWSYYSEPAAGLGFAAAMVGSALFAIFVFINLYWVHDYYLMAVAPALAIAGGMGLYYLLAVLPPRRPWLAAALAGLVAASYASADGSAFKPYPVAAATDSVLQVANALRDATRADELVVVADFDWNPALLYYARRRGFMLRHMEGSATNDFFKQHGFSTVVCSAAHPQLLANWRHSERVAEVAGFSIYKVADSPERLRELLPGKRGATRGAGAESRPPS